MVAPVEGKVILRSKGTEILRSVFLASLIFTLVAIFAVTIERAEAQQQPQTQPQAGARGGPGGRGGGFAFSQPDPLNFDDHDGWTQMFDGTTLNGWDGPTDVWSVKDGAIVGTYDGTRPRPTTYLIWKGGGEHANFEMKLEIKLEGTGANGGVQIRSAIAPPAPPTAEQLAFQAQMTDEQRATFAAREEMAKAVAKWNMKGYQPDFDWGNGFTGNLYEQGTGRGEIVYRGQVVEAQKGQKPRIVGTFADRDALKGYIKVNDWNQWEFIAQGNTISQVINGHLMSAFIDNDPTFSQAKGLIGLEIEGPGALKISHRNLWIRDLQ